MGFIRKRILIYGVSIFVSFFLIGCDAGRLNQGNIRGKQSIKDENYIKEQQTKSTNINGFSKPSPFLLPKKIREKQPYFLIQEQIKQLDPKN